MFRLRVVTKIAVVAGLILGLAAIYFALHRAPARLVVSSQAASLHADGGYHRALLVRRSDGKPAADLVVTRLATRTDAMPDGSAWVEVQAPSMPGQQRVQLQSAGAAPVAVTISFAPDSSDSFGDGTPEFLRLHAAADRVAFRGWFTALADAAATLPPGKLPKEIDDCAALLRWCYRNALHAHDETWQATVPFDAPPPLPSVRQFVWPETPLGATLFRVKGGAYAASDAGDGTFAQFADAHTLMLRNTFLVSRDLRAALPGDLLFYRQLEHNSPYHSMILTGGSAQWAVYHTGPIGRGPGEMRRVMVEDLLRHPDRQWRPNIDNENFLGVYRWNILRQDRR
jgi:uncharacterized protein YfaT (DUF1175 family)